MAAPPVASNAFMAEESAPSNEHTLPLSDHEEAQITALMTLASTLSPAAVNELRRRLAARQNSTCFLFRLPAELRTNIFEMAFLNDLVASERKKITLPDVQYAEDFEPTMETFQDLKALVCGPRSMNACAQIRSEVSSLLGLDKCVLSLQYPSGNSSLQPLSSPRKLEKDVLPGVFVWVYLHDKEETADFYAKEWVRQDHAHCSGVLVFPAEVGIKPRSFVVQEKEAHRDPEKSENPLALKHRVVEKEEKMSCFW